MAERRSSYNISPVFRFWVEIDGLLVGGFSEVNGLQMETTLEEISEGGVNDHLHLLPSRTKSKPLILKRGMVNSSEIWDWYEGVMAGNIKRKNGAVIMMDSEGKEMCRWNFYESYPIRWRGPELNASVSAVAVETVEIVHNGLKMFFS